MNEDVIQVELAKLQKDLGTYVSLSRKSAPDALRKVGGNFAIYLNRRLKTIAPAKGATRQQSLERMRSGNRAPGTGTYVRPRILAAVMQKNRARTDLSSRRVVFGRSGASSTVRSGRTLNLQALAVQRELNTRESGRGFVAYSSRYPLTLPADGEARSKFGFSLSRVHLSPRGDAITINWGPDNSEMSANAAVGLLGQKGRNARLAAISDTRKDAGKYIADRYAEAARKAGL